MARAIWLAVMVIALLLSANGAVGGTPAPL
jgi:hypothetical protein